MARKRTVEERKTWMENHLIYEREMLAFNFWRIHMTTNQLDWNSYFESFWIHARNLYHFLRCKGEANNLKASDYVSSYNKPPVVSGVDIERRLEPSVFHNGAARADGVRADLDLVHTYMDWFNDWWPNFLEQLPADYSDQLTQAGAFGPLTLAIALGGVVPQSISTVGPDPVVIVSGYLSATNAISFGRTQLTTTSSTTSASYVVPSDHKRE